MLKKLLYFLSKRSCLTDQKNILSLIEYNPSARLLDLGAGNGAWTKIIAQKIGTKDITMVDITPANKNIIRADLNVKFPLPSNHFDVISANQIIEHINNTETFLRECKRVLKKNGYALISTENLSSWYNIFALIMGWQPPSIDHNHPLSHLTIPIKPKHGHVKAFSYFGLKKLLQKNGFIIEKYLTSSIDPIHSHHLTIKVKKNLIFNPKFTN